MIFAFEDCSQMKRCSRKVLSTMREAPKDCILESIHKKTELKDSGHELKNTVALYNPDTEKHEPAWITCGQTDMSMPETTEQ